MTSKLRGTDATECDKALQPAELNHRQLTAVDALLGGANDEEAAAAAGVHRVTVNRWKNHNFYFVAELRARRGELWESAVERLRALLPKAIDRLEREIADGPDGLRAALELVKLTGLAERRAGGGPVDPQGVFDEMIREKRRRSDDEVLSDYVHGPITAEERVDMVKELHERGAFEAS
jgi:hypothetical protein